MVPPQTQSDVYINVAPQTIRSHPLHTDHRSRSLKTPVLSQCFLTGSVEARRFCKCLHIFAFVCEWSCRTRLSVFWSLLFLPLPVWLQCCFSLKRIGDLKCQHDLWLSLLGTSSLEAFSLKDLFYQIGHWGLHYGEICCAFYGIVCYLCCTFSQNKTQLTGRFIYSLSVVSLRCCRLFLHSAEDLTGQRLCDMFDIRLFLCLILSTKYQTYSYRVWHWPSLRHFIKTSESETQSGKWVGTLIVAGYVSSFTAKWWVFTSLCGSVCSVVKLINYLSGTGCVMEKHLFVIWDWIK